MDGEGSRKMSGRRGGTGREGGRRDRWKFNEIHRNSGVMTRGEREREGRERERERERGEGERERERGGREMERECER